MRLLPLLVFLVCAVCWPSVLCQTKDRNKKPYKVVCYLSSWAHYRRADGQFSPDQIDPHLCTHIIYSFTKLNPDNTMAPYDPYLDLPDNYGLGGYKRFNGLKARNPDLVTLIAIGGWNEGSVKYSKMAANPSSRKTFVASVLKFLEKHGFDGLDFDWEYPTQRGGKPEDRENYIQLLQELKNGFKPHGYLLSAAVSAGKGTIDPSYDVPQVSRLLDFINVMAYDFHGSWSNHVAHNSPLYPRPEDSAANRMLSVDFAVNYWISKGADPQKIILGIPLYGRSFSLSDPTKFAPNSAKAHGPGLAGPLTGESGMLGYNEICVYDTTSQWKYFWDDHWRAPYLVKGNQWIGYDDPKSISQKVNYLKSKGVGGAMVWSIETDDFAGRCGHGKFPLLTTINQGLDGYRPTQPEGLEVTTPSNKPSSPSPSLPHSSPHLPSPSPSSGNPITSSSPKSSSSPSPPTKPPTRVPPTRPPTRATTSSHASSSQPSTTPKSPTSRRTMPPTSPAERTTDSSWIPITANPEKFACPSVGLFRDHSDCSKFYQCTPRNRGDPIATQMTCGPGTAFHPDLGVCTHIESVDCASLSPLACPRIGLFVNKSEKSLYYFCFEAADGSLAAEAHYCPHDRVFDVNAGRCLPVDGNPP